MFELGFELPIPGLEAIVITDELSRNDSQIMEEHFIILLSFHAKHYARHLLLGKCAFQLGLFPIRNPPWSNS